mgnify:CR=1 FL=1
MAQRIRSVLQLSGPGRLIGEQLAIEAADRRAAADRAARAQSEAAQMAFRRQESEAQRQHSLDMAIEELFAQKEAASLRHSRDKEMLGLRGTAAEKAAAAAFERSKGLAEYTHQLGFSEREAAAKAQQEHRDRMYGQQTEQTKIAQGARDDARQAAERSHELAQRKIQYDLAKERTKEAQLRLREKEQKAAAAETAKANAQRLAIAQGKEDRERKLFEQEQERLKTAPIAAVAKRYQDDLRVLIDKDRVKELNSGARWTEDEARAIGLMTDRYIKFAKVQLGKAGMLSKEEIDGLQGEIEEALTLALDLLVDPGRKREEPSRSLPSRMLEGAKTGAAAGAAIGGGVFSPLTTPMGAGYGAARAPLGDLYEGIKGMFDEEETVDRDPLERFRGGA